MIRVAVSGTSGRVGRALADRLAGRFEILELPRRSFDLREPGVLEKIDGLDFDVLLNPAGMTSLEDCEDDPEGARLVNVEVPVALAERCAARGRKMLHFSTDYVLGGREEGLHFEDETVAPSSVYGETKALSEVGVLKWGGCVVRVSWVFGPEKKAFPDMVMEKALAGEPLAAVADKTSLPCYTARLADWVAGLVDLGCPNEVIHACQSGEPVSWHGMAEEVLSIMLEQGALKKRPVVARQLLREIGAFRAPRPRHSALGTAKLARLLGQEPEGWKVALREYLIESLICR